MSDKNKILVVDDDVDFGESTTMMLEAHGFEPDDSWLPVKEVLEKPVDPARFITIVRKALGKN